MKILRSWCYSLFVFVPAMMFLIASASAVAQAQEPAGEFDLSWEVKSNDFRVIFKGVDYRDVLDFTWNGKIVTDAVDEMIGNHQAEIAETDDGFVFSVKDASDKEEGDFGVMLVSGEVIDIRVPVIPVPSEKMCQPSKKDYEASALGKILSPSGVVTAGASCCGGYCDSSNPYPCCTNGSRPDGNCTWYAWYRAHQSSRGWGRSLPSWGNANQWCSKAKAAGYTVSSTPRGYKQGYSIGCRSSGVGHVAWVYDYDSKYVWVDEQNCCDCSVAGTRIGAKYARSYFKGYIYKK